MKKRLGAVLLTLALLASLVPVSAKDTLQGELDYAFLQEVAEFIRENGYYSDEKDDPLVRALVGLLQTDKTAWQTILAHMLDAYDDRTMFIPSQYRGGVQTSGYVGVGVTVSVSEEEMEVTDLNPLGSAWAAGMQPGDVLTAVDGVPADAFDSLEELADSLRGQEGTLVTVDVSRDGQPIRFVLERTFLGEPEFSARLLETGIYYMKWSSFSTPETLDKFHDAVEDMVAQGCQSLLLDLRGNLGGQVTMAYDVVNTLIPRETAYIKLLHREGDRIVPEVQKTDGTGVALGQIIVLVDENTASAAEIVVAGLCDTGHAVSIGTKTFGKGTAQYEVALNDDSLMIVTAFHVESVTRGSYDRVGIKPTYMVENESLPDPASPLRLYEAALSYGNCSDDAQRLNRALTVLGVLPPGEKLYRLGDTTQAVLDGLRQAHGLSPKAGLDLETVRLINRLLEEAGALNRLVDAQLDMALEFARAALAEGAADKVA